MTAAAEPSPAPADEPSLGALETLVGYHLRRASAAFMADFARALDGMALRQALVGILSVVAANPGINQGAAGRMLGIQRANMVTLITELVERRLVERQAAPGDRRAFALRLTPLGADRLAASLARIAAHEAEMLAPLAPAERAALIDLLVRITPLARAQALATRPEEGYKE